MKCCNNCAKKKICFKDQYIVLIYKDGFDPSKDYCSKFEEDISEHEELWRFVRSKMALAVDCPSAKNDCVKDILSHFKQRIEKSMGNISDSAKEEVANPSKILTILNTISCVKKELSWILEE